MIVDLEGLTGIAAFMNHAFWWIVLYGALSFGFAVALLVYGRGFRPWAAVPALCASVTFTMFASFVILICGAHSEGIAPLCLCARRMAHRDHECTTLHQSHQMIWWLFVPTGPEHPRAEKCSSTMISFGLHFSA